ncbi:putative quinol monooxygenase [Actinoplanes sp. NPDC049265]|uniref:putative quinol monooxygenase n=1 Tax=Actinoplanes sp. NPDC049265 TaxID=3363902 RepID=UPI003723FE9D
MSPHRGPAAVTMVVRFSVDPDRQDDLIAALDATGAVMRRRPGFLGSACYAGTDGAHVVNISHWASQADLEAARADPAGTVLAQRMFDIATPDPVHCVLRSTLEPPAA